MSPTFLTPFNYEYMVNAMLVSALIGGICGFLSSYLILKGWSLIGDALSHAIVPGVAGAYILGLPFSLGAFFAGGLAALAMLFLHQKTILKEDTIIGIIFTSFFGLGLFMASIFPMSVDINTIIFGNILAITPYDTIQLLVIGFLSISVMLFKWKDLTVTFFDESHARSIGLNPDKLKLIFFCLLAVSCIAALQTVGAFLVVAMLITPGATAFLLTDRFHVLIIISASIGIFTSAIGTYLSFFWDGATGAIIILLQTTLFLLAFFIAPKYGYLSAKKRLFSSLVKNR
ncbi:MAG: metal ABC transporter permease [Pseudomonadota bacterium]|nr:metal ABC transporter permease [Pseudomonadota bacterium]